MRAFYVTSTAHEPKFVFADSASHAAEIISVWHVFNGLDRVRFIVSDMSVWKRELELALSWGTSGIALLRPDGGWGIQQPRDERETL